MHKGRAFAKASRHCERSLIHKVSLYCIDNTKPPDISRCPTIVKKNNSATGNSMKKPKREQKVTSSVNNSVHSNNAESLVCLGPVISLLLFRLFSFPWRRASQVLVPCCLGYIEGLSATMAPSQGKYSSSRQDRNRRTALGLSQLGKTCLHRGRRLGLPAAGLIEIWPTRAAYARLLAKVKKKITKNLFR